MIRSDIPLRRQTLAPTLVVPVGMLSSLGSRTLRAGRFGRCPAFRRAWVSPCLQGVLGTSFGEQGRNDPAKHRAA